MIEEFETYETWLDNGNSVSDLCGDALAAALTEWFFDRRIGWKDEKVFNRYYRRNISLYLDRYKELHRIEPGSMKIDWMVQDYRELQRKETNKKTGTGSTESTVSHAGTVDTNDSGRHEYEGGMIHNYGTTDKDDETATNTSTQTVQYGRQTTETDIDRTREYQGKRLEDRTQDTDGTQSNYNSNVNKSKTDGGKTQTKALENTGTENSGTDSVHSFTGSRAMAKDLPMSNTFKTVTEAEDSVNIDGETRHVYSLRNSGLPSNGDILKNAYIGGYLVDGETATGSLWMNPTSVSGDRGAADTFTTYGHKTKETGGSVTEQLSPTTTDSTSTDNGGTTNKNTDTMHDEISHQDDKEILSGSTETKNEGNDTTTNDENRLRTLEHTKSGQDDQTYDDRFDVITNHRTQSNDLTDNSTGTTNDTSEENNRSRIRNTGRHQDPAVILQRAADYITRTNAFQWLIEQLDPCFLGVYDY